MTEFRTGIGTSTEDEIQLLGHDLAHDLLGKISFGELAYWLVARRRPTAGELRVFEAVLVALTDHGFTPTAIAARMTFYSAPDALQGAIAAGLLGGGSRFLGVTEDTAAFLAAGLAGVGPTDGWQQADWDALATELVRTSRAGHRKIPGLGHPVHKRSDPRTAVLIMIAREAGTYGPHLALLEAIGRVHPGLLGRTLPVNGAGAGGAALADLGLPGRMLRGFAILARTAGLLGHLAEEQQAPVGPAIYELVDRHAVYVSGDIGSGE
ncbi:MAG: citryl-CoA lyase [Microlunatus sp.]|nr:citryl-CoA lyase [Microlunatus sp.]